MPTCISILMSLILATSVAQGAELQGTQGLSQPPATAPAAEGAPRELPDVTVVAQAANAFAFDLYARFRSQEGNLFLSPASIHTALTMTYAGAAGQTAEQMAKVLHLDLPSDRLHSAAGQLGRQLNNPPAFRNRAAYELVVDNALWVQEGYSLRESFTSLVRHSYDAGINLLDFADPVAAAKTINSHIEQVTQQRIKDLVSPSLIVPRMTKLVITNAIYFKSPWSQTFARNETADGDFHLLDGQTVQVPLMHQVTKTVGYMETEDFQLVDLPYEGHMLSMTILLPRKVDGLEALEAGLSAKQLDKWLSQQQPTDVDVTLPRFTFTSPFELKQPLTELGMGDAFSLAADFGGMTDAPDGLFISEVLHKAFVAVDEQGTEAAAATAVMMQAGGMMREEPPVVFHADRPFVFLIRHRPSGAILFLGRLANPKTGS